MTSKAPDDIIIETRERTREKQKLESSLREARRSLAAERTRSAELGAVLEKEEADVRRLEGLGLTAMFHQFLGNKEDRLNKERQEVLTAKLKYDQSAHEVASLERDIADMEGRRAAIGDPEAEYARALERKEARIEGAGRADLVRLTEKDRRGQLRHQGDRRGRRGGRRGHRRARQRHRLFQERRELGDRRPHRRGPHRHGGQALQDRPGQGGDPRGPDPSGAVPEGARGPPDRTRGPAGRRDQLLREVRGLSLRRPGLRLDRPVEDQPVARRGPRDACPDDRPRRRSSPEARKPTEGPRRFHWGQAGPRRRVLADDLRGPAFAQRAPEILARQSGFSYDP